MEDALREGRGGDLEAIAQIARQTVELYGLPGYEKVLVDFQLAMAQRQASACLEALRQLLPSMRQPWQPSRSPLYRHMQDAKRAEPDWLERMLSLILAELSDPDNPECDFLRQDRTAGQLGGAAAGSREGIETTKPPKATLAFGGFPRADDGTRTRTPIRAQAPQACQSTNSSTSAYPAVFRSSTGFIIRAISRLSTGFSAGWASLFPGQTVAVSRGRAMPLRWRASA